MRARELDWPLFLFVLVLLPVLAVAQGRKSKREVPDLPTVYGAVELSTNQLTIDGDAKDWPGLRSIPLFYPFQVSGGQGYRGQTDLAGRAFFCWDKDNLYFCVAVLDDFHRPLAEMAGRGFNPAGPVGDGVYLRFDPRRDTRSLGITPQRDDDRVFWFGMADKGKPCALRLDSRTGKIAITREIELAVKKKEGANKDDSGERQSAQFWYEGRIPWKVLLPAKEKPGPNVSLGLEIVLEDFDSPMDTLPQTRLGWTFGSGPVLYPGNMGTLLLLDKPLPVNVRPQPVPRPMPGEKVHPGTEPASYWEDLSDELLALGQTVGMPGDKRLALLRKLDQGLANWPGLDVGVMVSRWQRFMSREFKGIALDRGAPCFLRARCKEVLKLFSEEAPKAGSFRLVRLPWSGWLLRSRFFIFSIDPFLPGLHKFGSRVDAVFLTNGLNPLRRDDQLIVEVVRKKLPCFSHVPIFIPRFDSRMMQLRRPGDGEDMGTAEVIYLGPPPVSATEGKEKKKSEAAASIGFDIRFRPAGPRFIFGGADLRADWVTNKGQTGKIPVSVLALPLSHPHLEQVLASLKPELFLPTDVLDMAMGTSGKVVTRLAPALERLQKLKGVNWRLMCWGEKFSIKATRAR